MKHLRVDQIEKLIQAAETPRNKLLFRMLYEHALRISECLALTKGSMQRGGYLRIRARKKGKHTDEKASPQTLELWERVTQHLCPGTMVFPFSRQWSDTLFHRACDKAEIELQPRMGVALPEAQPRARAAERWSVVADHHEKFASSLPEFYLRIYRAGCARRR